MPENKCGRCSCPPGTCRLIQEIDEAYRLAVQNINPEILYGTASQAKTEAVGGDYEEYYCNDPAAVVEHAEVTEAQLLRSL